MKTKAIYHVYPLGFCGKLPESGEVAQFTTLRSLVENLPHMLDLGMDTLYLGPVFESVRHGYDTVDYLKVDVRIGNNEDLKWLVQCAHELGIKVVLDTVFNHVSRAYPAFKDVCTQREASKYKHYFKGLRFDRDNPCKDGLDYETWDGHYELVKWDLTQPEVKAFLFSVAESWIAEYQIDGLRIDAADVMDRDFLRELKERCVAMKRAFIFISEVVHGDYNGWLDPAFQDYVTNYECYKGLYSSLNDKNYFEIDYALKRQFSQGGIYAHGKMYNFVDNHDVNRIGSVLQDSRHLYPLHLMLFAMPGVPSIYYGSEWGTKGLRSATSDSDLRRSWQVIRNEKDAALEACIGKLAKVRGQEAALMAGSYTPLFVKHQQMGFTRQYLGETIHCLFNSEAEEVTVQVAELKGRYEDILNGETFHLNGQVGIYGNWGRWLKKIG